MGSKYVGLEVSPFAAGFGSKIVGDLESFNITADLECFPRLVGLGLKVYPQSYLGLYYMNIYHWIGI